MTLLAIEVNDAAIVVARDEEIVAAEPGCAAVTDGRLVFGDEALHTSRLRPHEVNDRYWAELGLEALARPLLSAKTNADLVHAHLTRLWEGYAGDADGVLLIVPGSLGREQLGLLLGIAEACGMPVRGLVDAAAAASSCDYPGWDSIHAESRLHEIGLTRLGGSGRAVAECYEAVSDSGFAWLRDRWARCIAAAFVAQTRFDPLSDGETEQRFYDELPGWLTALAGSRSAVLVFDVGRAPRQIRFSRSELVGEAELVYGRVARSVAAARHPRRGLVVRTGPVLAALPGLVERLGGIAGVRVAPLSIGAGALGALASADEVRGEPGRLAMVTALRWRDPAGTVSPLRAGELDGSAAQATHLLVRSVAHPIPASGLRLRLVDGEQPFAISDREGDDADIVVRRSEQGLVLEHSGEARLLLNGDAAPSGAELAPGDRLGVAGSSEQALLIAVIDDGA